MARFYITTAIDYANGDPHIGHAFEKIGADVIARYRRLLGDDVRFLAGLDEHGHKVSQAAADKGVTPQELVDQVAASFQAMWGRLSISYDQYIRTTSANHRAGVRSLIKRIFENNPDDFYEKSYGGWYCVGCEAFKQEAEIVAGQCVLHPTRSIEWVEERNWFFRLSRYQSFLRRLIEERPDFIQPESRRNELLGLLDSGLEDISASRARFTWGVPFPAPLSTGETQTTYVWFDALPNYLTATGFPSREYHDWWPAQLHVVGKDITRFHAIIWPALLQAAELALPERVWAHGFVQVGGERLSKSAGAKLDLGDAIDRFGPDALRYFLLREVPFDGDGGFSWERFEERYTADLANSFGNLASRTLSMVEKYRGGTVPSAPRTEPDPDAADIRDYHAALDGSRGYMLHDALRAVWRSVARANEYVQFSTPWALARDPDMAGQLDAVLNSLMSRIARQAVLLSPFMPTKSEELWIQIGAPGRASDQRITDLANLNPAGWKVTKGDALFPRPEPTNSSA